MSEFSQRMRQMHIQIPKEYFAIYLTPDSHGCVDVRGERLTSLEGAPQEVKGNFNCIANQLTSLKGAPEVVGGHFYCNANQLTSLEGAPKKVGGDFVCERNARKFTEEEVRAVCDVKGAVYV